jgi:glycosyltransferase involved in cell wall biosynthesis
MQLQFGYICPQMRIAVNTRFLLKGKLEGIGWFTHQTLNRMVIAHPQHEFIFIFDRPYHPDFVFAANVTPVVMGPPARHPILWWLWFEVSIPRILKKYKADVFLSTDGFASLRTTIPQCLVIHDLAFVHYPQYIPKLICKYLQIFTKKFVNKADKIITVSQYTHDDVAATYNTPAQKLEIVYNSAHDYYKPLSYEQKSVVKQKYTDGADYFVYAGSLHPRKNIVNLLKAYAQFKKFTQSKMKLVLVGRLAWLTKEIEDTLLQHPNAEDIVRIDYMDAQDLSQVIGSAYAMVYVSKFEGFGIPILEAINCNIPVITSNTTSMPEVGGNACLLVNPDSVSEIADAMKKIYNDENCRNSLIANCAAQAAKFNWDDSAAKLFSIISSVSKA